VFLLCTKANTQHTTKAAQWFGRPKKAKNTIILMNIGPKKSDNKMKKILIPLLVLIVSTASLYSQNKTIKGKAITEDLEILPYTLIFINDTVKVGRTDLNGFFQIDIPVSTKKILFKDVGFEQATIELVDSCDEVEVVMMFSVTYDFMTLKKVDRLRMKRFKKLPALHKQAFEKGLFKTDKACYTQKFIPYYKKK
jgi:hypothetical protein